MSVTNARLTYGDTNRVTDVVLNAIEILTAQETMVSRMIGSSVARDTVHHYQTDTLATAASLAVQQGADLSAAALTTPSRLTNIVEEIAKVITVARPEQVTEKFSGTDEVTRQRTKGLKDFANALEFDLIRSTLVSGVSGTVAKMSGLIEAISKSTNTTAHTSGTVFSASILNGLMLGNWDNSNGDVATELLMGSFLRNVVDSFTQKSNVVVNAPGIAALVRTVSSYETSFGTLMLHTHRYVQQSSDATGRILAIRPEKLAIAWLDRPFIKPLAESGMYTKEAVYGSCTLEVRNQDSNWFASGFDKD